MTQSIPDLPTAEVQAVRAVELAERQLFVIVNGFFSFENVAGQTIHSLNQLLHDWITTRYKHYELYDEYIMRVHNVTSFVAQLNDAMENYNFHLQWLNQTRQPQ